MKLVVFGGNGQLGHEILTRARDLSFQVFAPVASEIDIRDAETVREFIHRIHPDVIINSAAYTAVDNAENDSEAAYAINAYGAHHVAVAAKQVTARLLYVSTDYVFGDLLERRLRIESDETNPLNVYGASKRQGEKRVLETLGDRGLVVRTSSLYGMRGKNFVSTMLDLFLSKPEVSVVTDQWMSPTWAGWLAEVLLDLCRLEAHGILHACNKGVISWYEFACAIRDIAKAHDSRYEAVVIRETTAEAFKRPATRAVYAPMATDRLESILGRPTLSWQDGLRSYLSERGFV